MQGRQHVRNSTKLLNYANTTIPGDNYFAGDPQLHTLPALIGFYIPFFYSLYYLSTVKENDEGFSTSFQVGVPQGDLVHRWAADFSI